MGKACRFIRSRTQEYLQRIINASRDQFSLCIFSFVGKSVLFKVNFNMHPCIRTPHCEPRAHPVTSLSPTSLAAVQRFRSKRLLLASRCTCAVYHARQISRANSKINLATIAVVHPRRKNRLL